MESNRFATTMMRCCFCGGDPAGNDYVQLTLHIEGNPALQGFGAHRSCLEPLLADGFRIELDPIDSVVDIDSTDG